MYPISWGSANVLLGPGQRRRGRSVLVLTGANILAARGLFFGDIKQLLFFFLSWLFVITKKALNVSEHLSQSVRPVVPLQNWYICQHTYVALMQYVYSPLHMCRG